MVKRRDKVPANSKKYLQTIIAFANGNGGQLVFGIKDETCNKTGLSEPELKEIGGNFRVNLFRKSGIATPQATPQATGQVEERFIPLLEYCSEPRTTAEMMQYVALKDRKSFREVWLAPLLQAGLLTMTIPDKPSSPKQKYQTVERL